MAEFGRRGRVAVLQASSHASHYDFASENPFNEAAKLTPWLDLDIYDEATLDEFLQKLQDDVFDGILLASGSMQLIQIRELVAGENAGILSKALNREVGLGILHQLLPTGPELEVQLGGSAPNFSIRRGEEIDLSEGLQGDGSLTMPKSSLLTSVILCPTGSRYVPFG